MRGPQLRPTENVAGTRNDPPIPRLGGGRILRDEPLCRPCAEAGFTVAAEHIDHIEPASIAPERFWDRDNIQPICRDCHERKHAGDRLTLEQLREREA